MTARTSRWAVCGAVSAGLIGLAGLTKGKFGPAAAIRACEEGPYCQGRAG